MSLNNLNFLSQGYQLGFVILALALFFIVMRLAQLTSEYNTLVEEISHCVTNDQAIELTQGLIREELAKYGLKSVDDGEPQLPEEPKPNPPLSESSKSSVSSKVS